MDEDFDDDFEIPMRLDVPDYEPSMMRPVGRDPGQIKAGTMHSTNRAFERYFRIEGDDLRQLYRESSPDKIDKELTKKIRPITKR